MSAGPPSSSVSPLSVVIVDDHLLLAETVAQMLRDHGHAAAVAHHHSLAGVLDVVERVHASAVLLDLDLAEGADGADLIPGLAEIGLSVVVVTGASDPSAAGQCLAAGAEGLIRKESGVAAILDALGRVAEGQPLVSHAQKARELDVYHRSLRNRPDAAFATLTPSEAATLGSLMVGRPASAIAAERYVSVATVRTQVRGVLTKLGVESQLGAVALAYKAGWAPESAA